MIDAVNMYIIVRSVLSSKIIYMSKRTIYITSAAELSVKHSQICIKTEHQEDCLRSVEDLGALIVDHHSVHLTVPLINLLAQNNVRVVFCNEQHIPTTMLMDLDSNVLQAKRFRAQLEAGKPLQKQIWKQIVERKIQNQSLLLKKCGKGEDLLEPYHAHVKSGDTTNREGIAAKVYWRYLFGKQFVRDRIGPVPNNLLNYGYALLRSAVARGLMDAGLLPSVGIFHRNYYNSFPLADDLMEPYRPFVDELVLNMYQEGERKITQAVKRRLVEEHYERLSQEEISATAHSLVHVFERECSVLYYPKFR